MELAVIVLNYRRAALTIECLQSLESEMAAGAAPARRCAIVVDNASDDGSADAIARAIEERDWGSWARLVRSPRNGGFAAGNNVGIRSVDAEFYLLLNSDARVRSGAVDLLLAAAAGNPHAGLIGPRLEDRDGRAQVSCFRVRSPLGELVSVAATAPLTRLLRRFVVALGVAEQPTRPQWVSFACVLVRREVIERVGLLDEAYFMYFEDIDYARRARAAGFEVLHDPRPRVVHLRGGTSSVKEAMRERTRIPRYYFESRSRYFAKFYGGRAGLLATNLLWLLGRGLSLVREVAGSKAPHVCAHEAADNWINFRDPLREPTLPGGGEL